MAVIIEGINKAEHCSVCVFSERIDNFHTICKLKHLEIAIRDTDPIADYCPVKEYKNQFIAKRECNTYESDVIENLEIAKAVLCHPNLINADMCIKIGQVISATIECLKEIAVDSIEKDTMI